MKSSLGQEDDAWNWFWCDENTVATENDSSCSYYAQSKNIFVPCSTYILVGVLDTLGLFSEVNAIFHFLIWCTLKNRLYWICYSKALVLEANPV